MVAANERENEQKIMVIIRMTFKALGRVVQFDTISFIRYDVETLRKSMTRSVTFEQITPAFQMFTECIQFFMDLT